MAPDLNLFAVEASLRYLTIGPLRGSLLVTQSKLVDLEKPTPEHSRIRHCLRRPIVQSRSSSSVLRIESHCARQLSKAGKQPELPGVDCTHAAKYPGAGLERLKPRIPDQSMHLGAQSIEGTVPFTLSNRPGFEVGPHPAKGIGRLIAAAGCQARTVINGYTLRFCVHLSSTSCQERVPAIRLSLALRSYRAGDLSSTQQSPPRCP